MAVTAATSEAIIFRPQAGPQSAFLSTAADIAIYGGAAGGGKSFGLLLEPLRHVHNPKFTALFFRQTSTQIRAPGGLWDESATIYPYLGATPREVQLEWVFPSGAAVKFAYLQYESDKYNYQGSQLGFLAFDELTHFSITQFFYMTSRSRSVSGIRPYVRATCNPDADSWVAEFIAWWIDQDSGLPIPGRAGVLRWFTRINEQFVWGDSAEEVILLARQLMDDPDYEAEPKSLTFIPAKLDDNPALTSKDPGYRGFLLSLPLVERERLLGGNWKIRAVEGNIFRRAWFIGKVVEETPRLGKRVRYWDKAGTPGGGKFTCGVLMLRTGDGQYYVEDVIREQVGALVREQLIKDTAASDAARYGLVETWVEQEPGSSGKDVADGTIRNLAGFDVHAERPTGEKLVRAGPYAAQCEGGNVFLRRAAWNGAYVDELAACPGVYMDQVDASSGAFNKLVVIGQEFRASVGGQRQAAVGQIGR